MKDLVLQCPAFKKFKMTRLKTNLFFRILRIGVLLKITLLTEIADTAIVQPQEKKITVSGKVTDEELYPIANAMILVDGRITEKVTNHQGKYRVRVQNDAKKIGVLSSGNVIVEEGISGRRQRINFMVDNSGTRDLDIR